MDGTRRWTCMATLLALGACGDGPIEVTLPTFGEVVTLADHREVEVRFESGGATLVGTLYLPPSGTDFATVATNPGSSWEGRSTWDDVGPFVLALDVAVFSHDKRGFGASGGTPVSTEPNAAFAQLSDDLVAAARTLRAAPHVRADRIGVLGGSQGGWIIPLAANADPGTISYVVSLVGGAVSTGQEGLFDELTGYSDCVRSPTPIEEINDQLRAAGPSGFDPRASLLELRQPTIWIYGGLDFSHPALFSAEKLAEVEAVEDKPWTVVILPNANHEGIEGGTICQTEGPAADFITPLRAWMEEIFQGA